MTKIAQKTIGKVVKFSEQIDENFYYVYVRWCDEKEYEDFEDYSNYMKKQLSENLPEATFIKATKRPFGFRFKIDGHLFRMCANSKETYIEHISN